MVVSSAKRRAFRKGRSAIWRVEGKAARERGLQTDGPAVTGDG